MKQNYLNKLILTGLTSFLLLGCSITEKQLQKCQNDFEAYAQKVENFYQEEIDKRVSAVIDENKSLKADISEITNLSESILEVNNNLALRIEGEESAVSHYRYCKLWGKYHFLSIYCDPQKAKVGLQLIEDNKLTFSGWTLASLILLTLITYLLPIGAFFGGLYVMFWRYKLEEKQREYDRVKKHHDYLEDEFSKIEARSQELHQKNESFTAEAIDLEALIEKLRTEHNQLESELDELKKQRNEITTISGDFK